MRQLWLLMVFLLAFSGNALADRGDRIPHDRSQSSYEHPSPARSPDIYQWNQYGFSQYTWKGFNQDGQSEDYDSTPSFDNDDEANPDPNSDLLKNEPQ